MIEIRQTALFTQRLEDLRDLRAHQRIVERVFRMAHGNRGKYRVLTDGVNELKIDYRPGYRVYYTQRGQALVILLCGGDKRTQRKDIRTAKQLAKEV